MPRQAPDERKQKRERPEKRERACSRSVALDEPAPAGVKLQLEDIPGKEAGGALVGDSGAPPQMLTTTAVTRPAGSSAKVVQSTSLVTS